MDSKIGTRIYYERQRIRKIGRSNEHSKLQQNG